MVVVEGATDWLPPAVALAPDHPPDAVQPYMPEGFAGNVPPTLHVSVTAALAATSVLDAVSETDGHAGPVLVHD